MLAAESSVGTSTYQSHCSWYKEEEERSPGIPAPPQVPSLWAPHLWLKNWTQGSTWINVLTFLIQSDQINSHHQVNLGLLTCDTAEVHDVPTCQLSCLPDYQQH